MPQTIDRESPVAYYEQLFGILRDSVESGLLPPGERLPSEMELCREYGLSRATVRQTMSKLESEGYARRVPRRGVFASSPDQNSSWTVQEGFLESQIRHGRTGIETRVISARWTSPPAHAAEALGVADGGEVFALERVRSLEGRVAMYSINWFPGEAGRTIAGTDAVLDATASVNETLRNDGYVTSGAQRVLRALRAPEQVATRLQIGPDQPVLRVRSLSWDADDRRFDYYETWVLTDVIPLEVNVSAG